MVLILALAAALSNALVSVLQRMGVEDAGEEDTMRLSLLAHAVRRGVWLAGFVFILAAFIFQALALHFGDMSEVQPVLVTELLFLVFILSTWFGYRVGPREWIGVVLASAGLSGFLAFSSPTGGDGMPGAVGWAVVGGVCVAGIALTIVLALRGPSWWRAMMFGASAAIGFAFTASLTKVVAGFAADNCTSIFSHWQTYALALFGAFSFFLTQNAFHAGPIGASQASIVLIDPLVSIAIGIALFGDNLQTGGVRGPLEALSLLVLVVGGAVLSHSAAVAMLKGDDADAGDLLTPRLAMGRAGTPQPEGLPPEFTS